MTDLITKIIQATTNLKEEPNNEKFLQNLFKEIQNLENRMIYNAELMHYVDMIMRERPVQITLKFKELKYS